VETLAHKIAMAIMNDLSDRSGYGQIRIDNDDLDGEIINKWEEIIENIMKEWEV
jgi:hypothetical protein